MLPKILRIRREDAEPRLVLRARASIALVAMIFPALLAAGAKAGASGFPASAGKRVVERASRWLLPNAFDPCADRVLSRGGQEKLRTHVTVRRSRYLVDEADIMILPEMKRGNRRKHGALKSAAKLNHIQGLHQCNSCCMQQVLQENRLDR